MMTKHCLATLIVVLMSSWPAWVSAGEQPPATGSRVCLVDGKEVKDGLHVDIAGVRLYACCEECLKKITENRGYMRLIQQSGREPEQIPIHRSREWTEEEVLDGMVLIPGGEFARPGSFFVRRGHAPEPVEHGSYRVQVSSFYMDKYEVTCEAYCAFLNDGNEKYAAGAVRRNEDGQFVPSRPERANFPIGGTNLFRARGYAQWAGKRLPTEAEWEYAHGGSEGRTYPWGEEEPGDTRANYGPMFHGLKPVGTFPEGRTPEGVFDLAGNIGEWCADYYDEEYYRIPPPGNFVRDPQGPETGFRRVYRLGCQCKGATPKDLRGNLRCNASPFRGAGCVGFRCVRSATPAARP
jgi:formylglycine-generating enzyme required for sulfatase activity